MRLKIDVDFDRDEFEDVFRGIKVLFRVCLDKLDSEELKDKQFISMVLPVGTIEIGRESSGFEKDFDKAKEQGLFKQPHVQHLKEEDYEKYLRRV